MAQNSSAPAMERMQPETLMRSLAMRMDCSAGLLRERDAQVAGEPEVVVLAGLHPGGEGVAFLLQLAAAAGVERDPGGRGLAVPVLVLLADFRVDGGLACARAASAASFRAFSASMACRAHVSSRSVPVSVTATSSRSTWAPHRAWPATLSKVS